MNPGVAQQLGTQNGMAKYLQAKQQQAPSLDRFIASREEPPKAQSEYSRLRDLVTGGNMSKFGA